MESLYRDGMSKEAVRRACEVYSVSMAPGCPSASLGSAGRASTSPPRTGLVQSVGGPPCLARRPGLLTCAVINSSMCYPRQRSRAVTSLGMVCLEHSEVVEPSSFSPHQWCRNLRTTTSETLQQMRGQVIHAPGAPCPSGRTSQVVRWLGFLSVRCLARLWTLAKSEPIRST
jgi:hypothetical protein